MSPRAKVLILAIVCIPLVFFYFYKKSEVPVPEDNAIVIKSGLTVQEGLPAAVAAKREAIFRAVQEKDYDLLASLAVPDFSYSFGVQDEGLAQYLRMSDQDSEYSSFDTLHTLLNLPYAVNANSLKGDIYTWPSVFIKESSTWTEDDIALMKTFLTDDQIAQYKEYGGYAYYRLGITTDGSWIFYLAGD